MINPAWRKGQQVHVTGSVDGSFRGDASAVVIDPHSNASEVTQTKQGREYAGAARHIRKAVVEIDRSKRGLKPLRFEAYEYQLHGDNPRTVRPRRVSVSHSHKGATVAKRRRRSRRRRSGGRRRRRTAVVAYARSNPRRRRRSHARRSRRRHRRNPGLGIGRGLIGRTVNVATSAAMIVAGKLVTRYVRSKIDSNPAKPLSKTMSRLVEAGVATAIGLVGGRVLGGDRAAKLMLGGYVGIVEAFAKDQLPAEYGAFLGDEGSPNVIRVPTSAARRFGVGGYPRDRVSGYPRRAALAGFPGRNIDGLPIEMTNVLG